MSSLSIYNEKNNILFCDSVEASIVSNQKLPTVSPFYVRKIVHFFVCDTNHYLYTIFHYSKGSKKIKLLNYNESDYSKQSHKFLSTIKQNLLDSMNSDIEFSALIPHLFAYGKRNISIYFQCGVDVVQKKKKERRITPRIEKRELSNKLFKLTQLEDLVGEVMPNQLRITRHNTYMMINKLANDSRIALKSINYTQVVKFATHYVENIDTISSKSGNYHCNTFHIYLSSNKIKSQVNDIFNSQYTLNKRKSEVYKEIYELIINYAIALFYINISNDNCSEDDFNVYNIFYCAMVVLNTMLFDNEIFTLQYMSIDTLYRKITKKFDQLFIKGLHHYIKGIMYIVNSDFFNQCLFPSNWTKEMKNDWKKDNGIVRKARESKATKVDDKLIKKVLKLHNDGYSSREIETKLKNKIGRTTIQKIIRNS